MNSVFAEVLTIGDELNRGEIVDTNSSFLAERLTHLGLHVRWRSSVTDDPRDMEDALERAASRAQVVVCSGGLGPTTDDRTVDVVCSILGLEAVSEPAHENKMRARFEERKFRITPNNLRQTRIPKGAQVLFNAHGMAPGFRVERGAARIYFMPGVPREMKPMFESYVAPEVMQQDSARERKVFRVFGMGESHVDHALADLKIPDGATLHYRVAFPETYVTLVGDHLDAAAADIRVRLGKFCYGEGDETFAAVIGRLASAKKNTLAVAESCTGGMLGEILTDVAGSSAYFSGGVISYSNEAKQKILGVRKETLALYGAVSEETVREMAEGARRLFDVDHAVAISGVAGPTGGTADKPVGTVWLAIATRNGSAPSTFETKKLFWPGARDMVRRYAAFGGLELLYRALYSPS